MKVNSDVTSTMRIGELAARTDVPAHRLRHYEEHGLLESWRDSNGYRYFDANAVITVARVVTLLHAGLNLDEIAEVLAHIDTDDHPGLSEHGKNVLRARAVLLEAQISCLVTAKLALDRIAAEGEIRPIEEYDPCAKTRIAPFNFISRPH